MEELRLEVQCDPGILNCNFDKVEDALRNQMQAYEELEVTEANLAERKKDVTTLRKIRDAVETERKNTKNRFQAPLKEFEAKVKNLTAILDEQINRIDGQIKEFDRKRVEEKQAHIKDLYDANIGEYALYLPLSVLKSSKWDLKTYADNAIISDIQTAKLKVMADIQAIQALGSEIEDQLFKCYRQNGNNLAAAIKRNSDYIEAKRAAEERVKVETAFKADVAPVEKSEPVKEELPFPEEVSLTVKVTGDDNVDALRTFLEASGIEYEEV